MDKKRVLQDIKIDIKVLLAGLWLTVMLLYIYCDIFSLYRTGQIETIMKGKIGFMDVNQMSLLISAVLMIIPTFMIVVSLTQKANVNRGINIAVALLYLVVNIGNLIGENWVYYFMFGTLEIGVILLIIYKAIRWPEYRQSVDI